MTLLKIRDNSAPQTSAPATRTPRSLGASRPSSPGLLPPSPSPGFHEADSLTTFSHVLNEKCDGSLSEAKPAHPVPFGPALLICRQPPAPTTQNPCPVSPPAGKACEDGGLHLLHKSSSQRIGESRRGPGAAAGTGHPQALNTALVKE